MRPGMCGQAMGGHGVLPAWGTSMACTGDMSGAWKHVDEAWDASTIYASMLDYIHLHTQVSATNTSRVGAGETIYVDENLMRNRSMQTTKIWTFFSAVHVCDQQGQEQ